MNSLDIGEKYFNQIKMINSNTTTNIIDDYNNNYNLKVTYVNIDSMFRNKIPSNIVETYMDSLPYNMIETTIDSNVVCLHINNHN